MLPTASLTGSKVVDQAFVLRSGDVQSRGPFVASMSSMKDGDHHGARVWQTVNLVPGRKILMPIEAAGAVAGVVVEARLVNVDTGADELHCRLDKAGMTAQMLECWFVGMSPVNHARRPIRFRGDIGAIFRRDAIGGGAQNGNLSRRKDPLYQEGPVLAYCWI